jgi:hypothetical protein
VNYFPRRYQILGPADQVEPRTVAWYGDPQEWSPWPIPLQGSPLPDAIPSTPSGFVVVAVLGYAFNRVVPTAQFSFLYESGGFNLGLDGLDSATYVSVYPPLAAQGPFSVTIATPSSRPTLKLDGSRASASSHCWPTPPVGAQRLRPAAARCKVDLDLELEPMFLKCDNCVLG